VSKKSTIWVGLLALIIIASAGGGYYWFGVAKPYQDFLAELSLSGVTYEQIEQDASGRFNLVNAKLEIGQAAPVAIDGFSFTKERAGYDLVLEQLGDAQQLLSAIGVRGVAYERAQKDSSGAFSFVKPTLDVGTSQPIDLDDFTITKAQTGYDLTIEQLEMAFGFGDSLLAIPLIEIKALEFADKIEQTENGLETPGFLAPFLHDKAASIRLKGTNFSSSFTFGSATISPNVTIGESLLEGIESGKITTYTDTDTVVAINLASELRALSEMVGESVGSTVAKAQLRDFNLKRTLEFLFLASDNAQAPFEEIYSAFEMENYQVSQFDGTKTTYGKLTASAGKMRGGKKAPMTFFHDLVAASDLWTAVIDLENDPRPLTLLEDLFSLLAMIGEQEMIATDITHIQNIDATIGSMDLNVDQIRINLKARTVDVSYHDLQIATNIIDVSIGKIALEDFSHTSLLDGMHESFKQGLVKSGEISKQTALWTDEEAVALVLGMMPKFGSFSVQDVHLAGSKNFPFNNMIGEWHFEKISLTNEYAFEQAAIPTAFDFEIKDFSVPAHIYQYMVSQSSWSETFICMFEGHETFVMNYKIKAHWDRDAQVINFDDNFGGNNIFGRLALDAQLGNVPPAFFSFDPLMKEADYKQITFKNLKMTYDPQGQDSIFFACLGKEWYWLTENEDPDFARVFVVEWIKDFFADGVTDPQFMTIVDGVAKFVKQGGKLVYSMKAKHPEGVSIERINRMRDHFERVELFDFDVQSIP